jgi:hypothetical protein
MAMCRGSSETVTVEPAGNEKKMYSFKNISKIGKGIKKNSHTE